MTPWSLTLCSQNYFVFVKHECPPPPDSNKVQTAIFSIKVMVTRKITFVSFERVLLAEYACQWSKNYGQGCKFLPQADTQTRQ